MNKPATRQFGRADVIRLSLAAVFIIAVAAYAWIQFGYLSLSIVVASVFGAYMAMNIGANDVANNVGPAVGAKAMKLGTAVVIAALFEAAGAIIAGGEVVSTIRGGIIDPSLLPDPQNFIWLMMAALLAGAMWLNLATALGAPVSTTHSIVGGVLGSGAAAAGFGIINWTTVTNIVISWVISPLFGGIIAALFLFLVKHSITYRKDMMAASRQMVPILIGFMAWAFVTYLLMKGLSRIIIVSFPAAVGLGGLAAVITYFYISLRVEIRTRDLENNKESVNSLFGWPLIFAAALLSFAHGSNDVANAIGPLVAIFNTLMTQGIDTSAAAPLWIMMLGAAGLALGLALYGPKLIKTVGSEITDMDNMRAYSIAMAAAVTVIIASQLGLPVSTTHVTIGAVFGVGFLREYLKSSYQRAITEIEKHHEHNGSHPDELDVFLKRFKDASAKEKGQLLKDLKERSTRKKIHISKSERKDLRRAYKENLVKRSIMLRVIAAWVVTVPCSALLAGLIYYTIRGMLL